MFAFRHSTHELVRWNRIPYQQVRRTLFAVPRRQWSLRRQSPTTARLLLRHRAAEEKGAAVSLHHPYDAPFRSYSTTRRNHNETEDADSFVVYESPYGGLVSRLRTISLLTAVAGSVGLPVVVALKGTTPTAGFLALCLSFGTGTLASTAAIHYVFSPYVFFIERIPVRKCHYPQEQNDGDGNEGAPKPTKCQTYLYKAITKSLFLTRTETVFDPETEVSKYDGFSRPLCNLVVRGNTHLFVHEECVYDNTLQQVLPFGRDGKAGETPRTTAKGTPARDKAADEDEQYFF